MKKEGLIKKSRFPRIFSGWWTVACGGMLTLWATGYGTYGFSALFKPISSELGFSRAATSIAASISKFEGGLEGLITGWLTDKFGPKWIVLFGVFCVGLGLVLMNYINSLWAFLLVWGGIFGTGHNVSTTVPIDVAISNWFVKKRGLALGLKMTFGGLSGELILPIIAWLIVNSGCRPAGFVCRLAV